jgi:hypothetical protein
MPVWQKSMAQMAFHQMSLNTTIQNTPFDKLPNANTAYAYTKMPPVNTLHNQLPK